LQQVLDDTKNNKLHVATQMLIAMLVPLIDLPAFPIRFLPIFSYTTADLDELLQDICFRAQSRHIYIRSFVADNAPMHREEIDSLIFDQPSNVPFALSDFNFSVPHLNSLSACPDLRHVHRCLINAITSLRRLIILGKYVVVGQSLLDLVNHSVETLQFPHNYNRLYDPQNHNKAIFYTDMTTIQHIRYKGTQIYLTQVHNLTAAFESRTLDHFSRCRLLFQAVYFFLLQRYTVKTTTAYKQEARTDARTVNTTRWIDAYTIPKQTVVAVVQLLFGFIIQL
jgi:hypothetical protein